MKTFKKTDLWISCLLITVFTIVSLVRMDSTFIIGYFTVGGWHVISMIVHAVNGWFTQKGSSRYIYHWIVFGIFALTALGFIVFYLLIIIMYIMLFAAPFMAVFYTWLCYDEVYVKMQRPITLLK